MNKTKKQEYDDRCKFLLEKIEEEKAKNAERFEDLDNIRASIKNLLKYHNTKMLNEVTKQLIRVLNGLDPKPTKRKIGFNKDEDEKDT